MSLYSRKTILYRSMGLPPYGPVPEAFQKPVLSSSFRSATEHAYKAVDGDLESQWASVPLNDQWLWVDLLGLYAVKRVVLLFGDVPQQFVPGMVWPRGWWITSEIWAAV